MPVQVSSQLTLPDNVVTQTVGCIARKGAGKTYLAGKITEGLLDIHAPVVVLDPVGNWYGLRLNARGDGKGFDIPVFGGLYGDIEITPDSGETLGQLLVERNLSGVIDVSSFRKNQRKHFVTDFAESFFHHAKMQSKVHRQPRMLVLEEAQVFAPQMARGEEQMLGAIEDIVRLGRNFGIGCMMISQRPQSINKEVLNQIECLFVGQLNAKHERDAIEAWVMEHKAEKGWVNKLPQLEVGNFMVWSPQWLKIMKEIKVGKKKTFDASSTPELGDVAFEPKKLTKIDVNELQQALKPKPPPKDLAKVKVDEEAANQISELQRQIQSAEGDYVQLQGILRQALTSVISQLGHISNSTTQLTNMLKAHPAMNWPGTGDGQTPLIEANDAGSVPAKNFFLNEQHELPPTTRSKLNKERKEAMAKLTPGNVNLRSGARRMLAALVSFYPGSMTKAQVAHAAKMKGSSGTFSTYWGELMKGKYIQSIGNGKFKATELGFAALGEQAESLPDTFEARTEYWMVRLRRGARTMLSLVIKHKSMQRRALAEMAGLSPESGTFSTYLGELTTNRLLARNGDVLMVHPWLKGEE